MLQIGRMKVTLFKRLKNKSLSIKLHSYNDNNVKENDSKKTTAPAPLITDMEFNWIEDY
jgi:hypothetical protein